MPSTRTVTLLDGSTAVVNDTGSVNFGGNSLRNQPEHKWSLTATYRTPIPARLGSLTLLSILSWRDQMYVDEANLDIYSVPEYTRWDARAAWASPTGQFTVTGWVSNLMDEIAVQSYAPREGNGVTAPVNGTITDARRIGLTFAYQL